METSEVVVEEHEDLFPPLAGEEVPVTELVHVIEAEKRIRYWSEKKSALDKEAAEVLDFYRRWYERRVRHCEERIGFNTQQIAAYMDILGVTKLPTPEGTPFFKTITKKEWPEDPALVAFAQENEITDGVRTKYAPDKKAIAEYIGRTGNVPDGYVEREERTLQIRQARRDV